MSAPAGVRTFYRHLVTDWVDQALCRGQDTESQWLAGNLPKGAVERRRAAAKLCRGCPVQLDCAIEAWNTNSSHYVFAGLAAGSMGDDSHSRFRSALHNKIKSLLRKAGRDREELMLP